MKRIVLSVLLILCFSSCSTAKSVSPYPLLPCGAFSLTYNDVTFDGLITYTDTYDMTIELTQPTELKGILIICNEDLLTVSKDDIQLDYADYLTDAIPFKQIHTLVLNVNLNKPEFVSDGDEFMLKTQVNSINYEVRLSSENQKIKSIKTGEYLFEFY